MEKAAQPGLLLLLPLRNIMERSEQWLRFPLGGFPPASTGRDQPFIGGKTDPGTTIEYACETFVDVFRT